jgi:hypothetical protein
MKMNLFFKNPATTKANGSTATQKMLEKKQNA